MLFTTFWAMYIIPTSLLGDSLPSINGDLFIHVRVHTYCLQVNVLCINVLSIILVTSLTPRRQGLHGDNALQLVQSGE